MKIGKQVIDALTLNPLKVKDEQYLSLLKEKLRKKHQQLIAKIHKQPMFYIEVKASSGY